MNLFLFVYRFLLAAKEPISLVLFYIVGVIWTYNFLLSLFFPVTVLKVVIAIITVTVSITSFLFIVGLFMSKFISTKNKIDKKEVEKQINKLELKAANQNLKFFIPSSKELRKWEEVASREAIEWAHDAKSTSFTLFLEFTSSNVNIHPNHGFYSEWKKQLLTVFVWEEVDISVKEKDQFADIESHKPFYEKYSKWDIAVEKAYEKMKDILPPEYEIVLSSHYDNFHFKFIFNHGKVGKKYEFDFDGNNLISEKDKSSIKI